MYQGLTTFISGITVFFGILAIVLFFKFISGWNDIDLDVIKARTYLAGKFVKTNIAIIFIIGILIVIHNFIEYMGIVQPDFYKDFNIVFPWMMRLVAVSLLLLALLLLEWLMYRWIKMTGK